MRRRPTPPRPGLLRRPTAAFGWLDACLLHERYLARLGPDGTAVLMLLALAADRHGASYYSRLRMADALGATPAQVDAGLKQLMNLGLVDFRPWKAGGRDGVWQLLPVTDGRAPRSESMRSVAELLRSLGLDPRNSA